MPVNKVLGIIHAYPSAYLLDSLADSGWKIALIAPDELSNSALLQHSSLIDVQLCDFEQPEQVIEAALRSHQHHHWQLVLPVNEGCVDLTAQVSEQLNLPGNSVFAATTSRSKAKTYQQFSRFDIAHPQALVVDSYQRAIQMSGQISYPVIVKLSDSMNSQGVIRVNDADEYQQAMGHLFALFDKNNSTDVNPDRNSYAYGKDNTDVVIQPFCSEEEIGIDLLYRHGEISILGVFEKCPSSGPYFAEVYSVYPTSLSAQQLSCAYELAKKAVFALDASVGAAHVEIRFQHGQPYVLEVGLRPGGGYTAIACEQLSGINSYAALADLILGGPLPTVNIAPNKAVLYGGVLYPNNGILKQVSGNENLAQIPGLIDWVTLGEIGDTVMTMPDAAQPHYAYYLLEASHRAQVLKHHQHIQQQLVLTIIDDQEPAA